MIRIDNNIDLLGQYAAFLEKTLNDSGYDISKHGILEITDHNFNITSEYLGRTGKNNNSRRQIMELRTGTENILDMFLENSSVFPSIDIVYAQMPFKHPSGLINKLSLVPSFTPAIAVFGAYGIQQDIIQRTRNINALERFADLLKDDGFDYDHVFKQTSNNYFDLIISKRK